MRMAALHSSPAVRISINLVLLTISILLFGNWLGLLPNQAEAMFDARKKLCESLAVQLTLAAQQSNTVMGQAVLQTLVDRNADVLSAALRANDGSLLAHAGDHQKYWQGANEEHSTATQARVPIYINKQQWATVEVRFKALAADGMAGLWKNPLTRLIALVALFGFFSYLILMRRTLRYLDPLAVIPPRVQATLDALTEGVILMDKQERIVLVNTAFAHKVGQSVTALLGQKASALNWKVPKSGHSISDYPWLKALHTGQKQTGFLMALTTDANELCTFVVNGSPIFDEAGNSRGALATFDDVTELEAKNEQLMFLATRDPLTGCLNRRALFEQIETDFAAAQSKGLDLSCIMCDIDHFKDVNDYYGHATGDQVLKSMVTALQAMLGQDAAIGRYGGEEFSILLKGVSIEQAAQLAEQCRSLIEDQISAGIRITASFGVSSTGSGAGNTQELLSQADKCLYAAKHSGRNRVIRWDDETTKPSMRPTTSFTRSVNRK